MHDNHGDINGREIFAHESINLADFHTTTSASHRCSVAAGASDFGAGDSGDRDQRGVYDGSGGQRCCWRRGKESAGMDASLERGRVLGMV